MKTLKINLLIVLLSLNMFASDLDNFFVDVSAGLSNTPYSKSDSSGSININKLDENGYLYDLALGYRINDKLFTTLNYQYSKFKEIDFDDYYVTLNYQFNHELKPYVGVLVGKSFLHWNKDPLNSSQTKDYMSGSFMYGIQTGLEYQISNNISFIPKVMYSRTDHGTNLISSPARSYVEHDSKTQVLLGVRYSF
jgi:predicted porin